MWHLEMIQHINKENSIPLKLIEDEISKINFKTNSFNVLSTEIMINGNFYTHAIFKTEKSLSFINKLKLNSRKVLHVPDLNIYLFWLEKKCIVITIS